MTYEIIFMRRRNSQIIGYFQTEDLNEFKKLKRHIITNHGLVKIRSGRANNDRYSQVNHCDYVMITKTREVHKVTGVLDLANKCFKEDTSI